MKPFLKVFFLATAIAFLSIFVIVVENHRASEVRNQFAAYEIDREKVIPKFEIQNTVITFYLFDTIEELREELGPGSERLLGLSECEWNPDEHISYCFIWAVRPTYVDDEEACTLGHEVMHAVYGTYHTAKYTYDVGAGCK